METIRELLHYLNPKVLIETLLNLLGIYVYFGLFFGFLIYPLIRRIEETEPFPRFWLFLAMIPMGVDWSLGFFEIWENTHLSRFVTGAILGTACGLFIVPALVELLQLLVSRRQGKKLPL